MKLCQILKTGFLQIENLELETLDRETRGKISELLHKIYEKQNIVDTCFWAMEADEKIISKEDFALGYILGALANISNGMILDRKLRDKIRRDFTKPIGKEATEKLKPEAIKPLRIDTTALQYNEVKNMLIPMIAQYRTKIGYELGLKSAKADSS